MSALRGFTPLFAAAWLLLSATASGQTCTISLSPTRADHEATSGDFSFEVQTSTPDCTWRAQSSSSLVTILAGATLQTGSGVVTYSLTPTQGGRVTANIVVSGAGATPATFTLTYLGACSPPGQVYPSSTFGPAGGIGYLLLQPNVTCSLTPVSTVPWITFGSPEPGLQPFTVAPFTGSGSRSGSILVDGREITITQQSVAIPIALAFYPVAPCRVADTRDGDVALQPGIVRTIRPQETGCPLAPAAAAYSFNITVVPPASIGYLSVWPTGTKQPLVSTLNAPNGGIVANAAVVPAGIERWVDFFSTDRTHLVVDANGYFAPPATGGLAFFPLTPCRLVDTRLPGNGPALAAGATRTFSALQAPCGVPSQAQALSLNATVVPSGSLGFLTLWPGGARPLASTLNAPSGQVVANASLLPLMAGSLSAYATESTHLVLDTNGYFAPPAAGGLYFYPVTPCRVLDTRNAPGPLGGPALAAGDRRAFPLLQAGCGIAATAQAVVVNATVVPASTLGYLTLWPSGLEPPLVSTLNAPQGGIVANMAVVPLGASGSLSAFSTDATHLVLDVMGYFARDPFREP